MYIGIDLGTSNSAIAGVADEKAQVFRPADGGEVLPSVIYIDKRGHRLYGRRAYDQTLISPECVAAGFKRLMGTATPIEITGAEMSLSPEECSAEIITQLLGQASTETGEDKFDGAVIAIPAAFNQMQAEATMRAAKLAGLENVDLIQEPVAAALAAMAGAKRSGKFLVYDLGGGTFDVSLLDSVDGEVKILAQRGVNMLGGRDFDRMIVHEVVRPWLLANFDLPVNFMRHPDYRRLARLAQMAAEKAKIDLSSLEEAAIFVSDDEVRLVDQADMELFLDAPITRSQFEELIREPIENTVSVIRTLLEENEVEAADVDRIVFIGGPTRIPLIRKLVSEALGIEADLKTDPMTAVAEGAAYFCEGRVFAEEETPEAEASAPKPTQGHEEAEETKNLSFDFPARTPDEKATILVRYSATPDGRKVKLTGKDLETQALPVAEGTSFIVSLPSVGKHKFQAHILGENGEEGAVHDITVSRIVAAPQSLPAAQTIAVKIRQSFESEENSFLTLVKKGDSLPAHGQVQLKSARTLKSGNPGFIGFEVFQVEYPERVELNLCVGLFKIQGSDLPKGHVIREGEPLVFNWKMTQGGLLQASVSLPASNIDLKTPRFYAPQAGQVSYEGEEGRRFAKAVLDSALEEWGDLAAAVGPDVGPEITLLKTRLDEQREIFEEDDDAETARLTSEESRFIRQDIVRASRKHQGPLLQRQLGKLNVIFNRACRSLAEETEKEAFDKLTSKIQTILDDGAEEAFPTAQLYLAEMRKLFFSLAWRNPSYVEAWFTRLTSEPWLFVDQEEFDAMVKEGRAHIREKETEKLSALVLRMLAARTALGANDAVSELASIIKA